MFKSQDMGYDKQIFQTDKVIQETGVRTMKEINEKLLNGDTAQVRSDTSKLSHCVPVHRLHSGGDIMRRAASSVHDDGSTVVLLYELFSSTRCSFHVRNTVGFSTLSAIA